MKRRKDSSCSFCTKKILVEQEPGICIGMQMSHELANSKQMRSSPSCLSNVKSKGCALYTKKTWISLLYGIYSLPNKRALSMTVAAQTFLLHLSLLKDVAEKILRLGCFNSGVESSRCFCHETIIQCFLLYLQVCLHSK